MLNFIISRSGGGKTTYVMDKIEKLAKSGKKSLLIVPEQFSFTAEKSLIIKYGDRIASEVDVLSFTALAERLTEDNAVITKQSLSQSAAGVIMSLALKDTKDELRIYGKHSGNKNIAGEFVSLISEFKQNAISADDIAYAIKDMPDSLLKSKLRDIEIIMRSYNERVSRSFFNPDDLLTLLVKSAELDTFITGKTIFIDSFRGFTAQEYGVIEHFLKCSDDVFVSLTSDYSGKKYSSDYNITEPFAKTKRTAARLIEIAEKAGVTHPTPGSDNNIVFIEKENRYMSGDIAHLEKAFALDIDKKYESKCSNIILCKAPDIYTECSFIAATAKKLIREKNIRCREIAIIARKIDKYEKPLKSALKKYGIPIYEDFRKPIDASPVINTVSSALSAASGNFDNDSMMRYIKSGLTGLTTEEASLIENYCFVWNIRGKKWLNEWTSNPEGFGEMTEQAEYMLITLNKLRKTIVLPIIDLKSKIGEGLNGADAVKAVWEFIEQINLREMIKDAAEKLISDGEEGSAFEFERMWDTLIKSLDDLSLLLKDETVNLKSFSDSMEIMLHSQTIGNLPQGLDEIFIGSADRMRIISPKIAFVIGANEGVFPPDAVPVSALTLKDRNKMAQFGIELSDSPEWKIADENLIAYSSLCCAREFLAVTCSEIDADGSALNPGPFYKRIRELFPAVNEYAAGDLGHLFYTEGTEPAFEEFAKSENGEFKKTIGNYFSDIPEYEGRLKSLDNVSKIRNFEIENKETTKKLYKNFNLSASRIEKFYKCPFSYFCNYGLKLRKLNEAGLDDQQTGNITHSVLENILRNPGVDELIKLSERELKELISSLADQYIAEFTQNGLDSERFKYRINVAKRVIYDIVTRICEEFRQSEFRPDEFELLIGSDEVPAYKPEGSEEDVRITGYIDRVDIAVSKTTGKKYFRIIDYKTGNKDFSLSDILNGINLQMLIYMFALESKNCRKYEGFKPAGVLYYKAKTKIIKNEDLKKPDDINKTKRMDGVVLDDENLIRMMESNAEGRFIHASVKDGEINGLVLTDDEFNIVKCKTDYFINEMVDSLKSGNISALPKISYEGNTKKSDPCKYCEFKPVCRYDEDIETVKYTIQKDEKEREALHKEVNPDE